MAYEIISDLRHTSIYDNSDTSIVGINSRVKPHKSDTSIVGTNSRVKPHNADDIMTWANLGPGGVRGLRRVCGLPPEGPCPQNHSTLMIALLKKCSVTLKALPSLKMPPLEMREIEHSLCEYDKYERACDGEGQMKRRYNGQR